MSICFHCFVLKISIHFLYSQYVAVYFLHYSVIAFSLCVEFYNF